MNDTLPALKNNAYTAHNTACTCIRAGTPWCSEALAIALAKRAADLPAQR